MTSYASSDGKFLTSGGRHSLVRVWDVEKGQLQASFAGHRDAVSVFAIRLCSHSLCRDHSTALSSTETSVRWVRRESLQPLQQG
ncbi:hypothetical protein PF003_g1506 [Phytophthora fragariae]|nr:hypothetical protein PF003_g1506 [Phytophthora fragariae]